MRGHLPKLAPLQETLECRVDARSAGIVSGPPELLQCLAHLDLQCTSALRRQENDLWDLVEAVGLALLLLGFLEHAVPVGASKAEGADSSPAGTGTAREALLPTCTLLLRLVAGP